jgi:hypothetical protein
MPEYFTEVPEIASRPRIQAFWEWIGRRTVPNFNSIYSRRNCSPMSESYHVPFRSSVILNRIIRTGKMLDEILQREKIIY